MKVLKAPPTDWEYKHTCEKCDAELVVEADDLHRNKSANTLYCFCPICKNTIYILVDQVPKIVMIGIEKKNH